LALGIDAAVDEAVDIAGDAQDAVRVRAAQIGFDVGIGHQCGVCGAHAASLVDLLDQGVYFGVGDADINRCVHRIGWGRI
jgi:bacterioferritin-associated ferredoxin